MPARGVLYSQKIQQAIRTVEDLTNRKVIIGTLGGNEDKGDRLAQGFHAREGKVERIWLNVRLSPAAYEATAAHELAHILQKWQDFPFARANDQHLAPLADRVNNLVLDIHADRWALAHGFQVGQALAESGVTRVVAALRNDSQGTASKQEPSKTDPRALAVDYAALRLRLERFGLFTSLDAEWDKRWLESRALGLKISKALARRRFSSAASCRRAMETVLKLLKVPPESIQVTG